MAVGKKMSFRIMGKVSKELRSNVKDPGNNSQV